MLSLLACAPADPTEIFVAPDATGPYGAVTWADSAGDLTVQVWAPTEDPRGTFGVEYDELLSGEAWSQGDLACEQPRPVVMFSHGNSGARWQSFFVTEDLAEHGAVVVAPDHTHNTFFDYDDDQTAQVALDRPRQIAESFDWLLAESADPESRLHGCVASDAGYLALGHSFGGWTVVALSGARFDAEGMRTWCEGNSYLLCGAEQLVTDDVIDLSDERVDAVVSLTPAGAVTFGPYLEEADRPSLIVGGSADETTPYATETLPMFEGLPDADLATLVGAGHFSFTEICALPIQDFDGCTEDFLPIEDAHRITTVLTLAWLKRWQGFTEAEGWLPFDDADLEWISGG